VIVTRREFLKKTGLLGAAAAIRTMPRGATVARPALNASSLAPFVDALATPPVAHSTETRPSPGGAREQVPYYRVAMREFERQTPRCSGTMTTRWGSTG